MEWLTLGNEEFILSVSISLQQGTGPFAQFNSPSACTAPTVHRIAIYFARLIKFAGARMLCQRISTGNSLISIQHWAHAIHSVKWSVPKSQTSNLRHIPAALCENQVIQTTFERAIFDTFVNINRRIGAVLWYVLGTMAVRKKCKKNTHCHRNPKRGKGSILYFLVS